MMSDTTKSAYAQRAAERAPGLFDKWFDPIETALRNRVRGFIEVLFKGELEAD